MDEFKKRDVEVKLDGFQRATWIGLGVIYTCILGSLTLSAIHATVKGIKGSYIDENQNCRFID